MVLTVFLSRFLSRAVRTNHPLRTGRLYRVAGSGMVTGMGRGRGESGYFGIRPDRFGDQDAEADIHLDARQSLHLTQMFEGRFVSPEILMCSRQIERRDIGIPEEKIERTDFRREITRKLSTPEKEFLTCKRRSRATVRSFEENCSKSTLKVTQAPTECRLPDVESLCYPTKAFVLSYDNSPAQRSKFKARRVSHVSMRYWPLADKSVFRGVGNQPWQP
jgi:hypothetical protein